VYQLWPSRQSKQLNKGQKRSVELAMSNQFQLIQGPPGNNTQYTCILYRRNLIVIMWPCLTKSVYQILTSLKVNNFLSENHKQM